MKYVGTIEMEYVDNLAVFERTHLYNRVVAIKNQQTQEEEKQIKEMKEKSLTVSRQTKAPKR